MFDKYRIFRIVIYLKIYFPYENFFLIDSSTTKAGVNLILFLEDLEVFLTNDFEIFDHVISLHRTISINIIKTSNEALKFFFQIFDIANIFHIANNKKKEIYEFEKKNIKKKGEKFTRQTHLAPGNTKSITP